MNAGMFLLSEYTEQSLYNAMFGWSVIEVNHVIKNHVINGFCNKETVLQNG